YCQRARRIHVAWHGDMQMQIVARRAGGRKLMRYAQFTRFAGGAVFVVTALASAGLGDSSALAEDARSYAETAQSYAGKGNLRAAEIELRNAVRQAPEDAHIHGMLSQIYLKLGESASAEREARSA